MYKKKDQEVYYLHKMFLAAIFDNEHIFYKNISWMFDLDSLKVLDNLITAHVQKNYFSDQIKNNIYEMFEYGRNIEDEYRNERIEAMNNMIIKLNSCKDDSLTFYANELYYRRNTKKYADYYEENIIKEIPSLDDSIFNDFMVLFTHKKEEVSDEVFENEYILHFLMDLELYYESLNVILHECPSMFEDETFKKRCKCILDNANEINNDYKKLNKVIKKIKR